MATTLTLEPPSTTFLDDQNSLPNTMAQTSSKTTVLSRLRRLGSELKKALPKPPKRKRKQASASASSSSSEGMEEKPTSSPMKTEAKKQEEIIQIQSPTSSKSTKSTIPICLPLKNILVPKRKQASPKGQGLEEKLPSSSEKEAIQTQSPTPSNSTKKAIPSCLSLKNVLVLKRRQTLLSKEPEEKVLPSSSEMKPSSSSSSSSSEEEQKPLSSSEEEEDELEQKPPSSTSEEEEKPLSSSEEEQKPPSSEEEEEEEQQEPPPSSDEEEQEQEQKPPSSDEEEEQQKPPSSSDEEEEEEKQPSSEEEEEEQQEPPSEEEEEEEEQQKPPSSDEEEEEEEQKPPSSEEEEEEEKEEQEPPSSSEEEQEQKPPSSSDEEEEEQKPPSSEEEEEEQEPPSSEEQKPPSSTSGEEATKTQSHTPSNSTTTTIPSCFSLKNILVPKTKQALSSKGLLKEKLASSSSEVKLPSSSEEDAIQTLSPNPSNSTKKTIPSCLSLKNILLPKRKQALSSKLELKMPSSSSSEEAIQTPPSSSSEPAPTVDDKRLALPTMSTEKKYKMVRSVGEECTEEAELQDLLANKPQPICYDGFEPSGLMHIAQGIMKTMNVNKLTSAGCRVKILIADEFARINKKLGGDMEKIETVGRYMIEVWKAMGMNLEDGKVEFLWSSKEIRSRAYEYWALVLDIAESNNLARLERCTQIMGRNDRDKLTTAQIFYPCMQCADIFFLQADICQMGLDQRKVNMLAREYCDNIKRKNKPIILSHHMLPGLKQRQEKMSKSIPDSAIFMNDSEDEVKRKINDAFCPLQKVEGNPCLEYIKYLIFPWFDEFVVERTEHHGGDKTFTSYEELIAHYGSGQLHPKDLKNALSKAINKIVEPVREHFEKDETAKQLLQTILSYEVTR